MTYREIDPTELMDLLQRFRNIFEGCEIDNIDDRFMRLVAKYSEPHRNYHNLGHIAELFELFDEHADAIKDKRAVALAIFYHDFIYEIPAPGNEAESAQAAESDLAMLGVDEPTIARVSQLINMTKSHVCDPEDTDAALFMDMDMAIIGAQPADYARYADAIEGEWRTIYPAAGYYQGRTNLFLVPFSQKPRQFITDTFETRYGAQANTNLRQEIDTLAQKLEALQPPRRDT